MIGKLNATLSVLATCLAATAGGVGVARGEGEYRHRERCKHSYRRRHNP